MAWKQSIQFEEKLKTDLEVLNKKEHNLPYNCANKLTVTGYSFNSKDLFLSTNFNWPPHAAYWDPNYLYFSQSPKPCLPLQNTFTEPNAEDFTGAVREPSVFIRTSPNQIIRHQPIAACEPSPARVSEPPVVIQNSSLSGVDSPILTASGVVVSPQTTSSGKNSQRGRPKGSKNKPKPLPVDFLEPVQGEDGVTTRAQRTWLIGKQLGLKPRGSEALMIKGLEAQIRLNHPHLR